MPHQLVMTDADSARDVLTFAARTAKLGDGCVRLKATDGVLVVSSAPLAPVALGDATPTVLGMRVLAVDLQLQCDLVVEAATLAPSGPLRIDLPDVGRAAAWAAISPPPAGWEPRGEVSAASLKNSSRAGIEAVAQSVPPGAGEDIVRRVRASIWARPHPELTELPAGVAFVASMLGFLGEDEIGQVFHGHNWIRISLRRGHVLVRTPSVVGLTPVRVTTRRSLEEQTRR